MLAMAYAVALAPDSTHVVVSVSGSLTLPEVTEMVSAARAASDGAGVPILYDMSAATPGDISKSDLFWMPRKMGVLQSPWARRVRVALLHPAEHVENARFWETSFRNLGLDVKAFTERSEAIAWLQ